MNRWMIGLVMACTLAIAGCSKGVVVENPAPFAAAASASATEQAILDALPKHNWSAENVEPGKIVGFLTVRSHLLRVDISYDDANVILAYRDSDNLNEERTDSGIIAHKKVNQWMGTLANDIRLAIAAQPAPSQDATLTAGGEAAAAASAADAPAPTTATAPAETAPAPAPAP